MLIEPHAVPCASKGARQRCLAPFERFASQVVAVQLDHVERPHKHAAIVPPVYWIATARAGPGGSRTMDRVAPNKRSDTDR